MTMSDHLLNVTASKAGSLVVAIVFKLWFISSAVREMILLQSNSNKQPSKDLTVISTANQKQESVVEVKACELHRQGDSGFSTHNS